MTARRLHALSAVALAHGAAALIQLVTCVVLALVLSPAEVGRYFLLLTLVNWIWVLGSLGLEPLIERNFGSTPGVVAWALPRRLIQALLAAVLLAAAAHWFGFAPPVVVLLIAIGLVRCLGDTSYQMLVALNTPLPALFTHVIRLALRLPTVILGYEYGQWIGVGVGLVLTEIALAGAGVWWTRPQWRTLRNEQSNPAWKGFAVGAGLATLALTPILKGGMLIVATHAPPESVAHYGIAWQLCLLILGANFVFCRTQLPLLRSRLSQWDFRPLVLTQAWGTWWGLLAVGGTLFFILEPAIPRVLGTAYLGVLPWTWPCLLGAIALCTNFVFFNARYARGQTRQVALPLGGLAAFIVILSFPAMQWVGPIGFAWTFALGAFGLLTATAVQDGIPMTGAAALLAWDGTWLAVLSPLPWTWALPLFLTAHLALVHPRPLLRRLRVE